MPGAFPLKGGKALGTRLGEITPNTVAEVQGTPHYFVGGEGEVERVFYRLTSVYITLIFVVNVSEIARSGGEDNSSQC